MTSDADLVEAFQRRSFDHLGRPLQVDGVEGQLTRWARPFELLPKSRRVVVRTAQWFIGLEEDPPGSNRDPAGRIAGWLDACGVGPGEPWCAAFASHCLHAAGLLPEGIAGAVRLGKHYPSTGTPTAGDLFWYPTGAGRGHIGIVIGVGPAAVMTIEGNCKNAVRCVRRERPGLRFASVCPELGGAAPPLVDTVPPAPGGTR